MHALLWMHKMFPNYFRSFIFVNARTVAPLRHGGREEVEALKVEANSALSYLVNFCHSKGWAAKSYLPFGTDPVDKFTRLAERVSTEFPNSMLFASMLIFCRDNWFVRLLHDQAALVLQRHFHLRGLQMVILPMKIAV
jgi:hypothetical protein